MYITIPLRKQKNLLFQRKHQQFIFKEIQQNAIFEQINQKQEINRSNGFQPIKQKFIHENYEKSSFKQSQSTLRRKGSITTSEHFRSHRPSVSSLFSIHSKSKQRNYTLKTTDDFSQRKNNLFHDKDTVQEKNDQKKNKQFIKSYLKFSHKKKSSQDDLGFSFDEKPKQKLKQKKKSVTLLDLKIKNIQEIIQKVGKKEDPDFASFVQKDHKFITKSCWNKFYGEMIKNSTKKSINVEQKIKTLRRTAATNRRRQKVFEPENSVQELFVQKKKASRISWSECVTARNQTTNEKLVSDHQAACPVGSEKVQNFFNFVKGGQNEDEYSNNMSLFNYQKQIPKFYILKNSEDAIKQSQEYQKITMQNYKDYQPEQMISFVYLNENQYKLQCKRMSPT